MMKPAPSRDSADGAVVLPPSPFPAWAAWMLKLPLRAFLIDRTEAIRAAGIREGDTVLELGAGSGFWTAHLSRVVGPNGRVYAHDVQQAMLDTLTAALARTPHPDNLTPMLSPSTAFPLADDACDAVYAAYVFEEIETEGLIEATADELVRVLREGGHLGMREYRWGVSLGRITHVFTALESAGFVLEWTSTSRFSYQALFTRPPRAAVAASAASAAAAASAASAAAAAAAAAEAAARTDSTAGGSADE